MQRILLVIEYVSAALFLSTHLIILCQMVTSIVASRLEKVSEPARALSADTADYQQLVRC